METLKRVRLHQVRSLRFLAAFCLLPLVLEAQSSLAQTASSRPITSKDFDSWKDISGQVLSPDGRFLAYGVFPEEGDGEVIVRDLKAGPDGGKDLLHLPAGELPPPPVDDPNAEGPPPPRNIRLSFTQDSKTLVFLAYATHSAVEKAKKDKTGPAHEELVLLNLASATPTRVSDVKSVQVPARGDGFIAYLKYGPPAPRPTAAAPEAATSADQTEDLPEDGQAGRSRSTSAGSATPTSQFGSQMVLRKLADGSERQFADVLEYALGRDGKSLAYSVASVKPESDGVFLLATAGGEPRGLITGRGRYEHVTWNEGVDQLAFIGNPGEGPDADEAAGRPDAKKTPYKLYLWKNSEARAAEIVSTSTPGFHPGYVVAEHAMLTFSKDGSKLFFGAAPPPPPPHAAAIDQDKPSFDLWRTGDDYIQPVQRVRAPADLNRSFRAVYLIQHRKMLQLADDTLPEVLPNETGRYALGTDDRTYRAMLDYGNRTADFYLVDVESGARTPLLKKQEGAVRWSGDGKYLLSFDGKDWSSIAVPSGKSVNLTAALPAKFFDEENDVPAAPVPYGVGAWAKDDKYVLLHEHFDVWQVAPEGGSAVNLTAGEGRRGHLEFRYVKTNPDPDVHHFDPAQPILLRAESSVTHDSGFYTTTLGAKQPPSRLLFADKDFSLPVKAEHADTYVLTAQTFTQFPDLMVTDASFTRPQTVSDANPQKAPLAWGTDEMVSFESLDGVPLQGVLYKPANFDPGKKYPMIVYLYEKLSENIHHFVNPRPMDSINIAYYVSNGYLVLTPDIVYTIGYPGQSALKCVLAGVNAVTAKGFVDEKNIGIQGHSWGGYQIAYMMTQTNRFKAAEDGAPVVNMISAYDGIRWGPGRPRQFQYEQTQSRIGGTPWQVPLRYLDNSPIFYAERIQTPLLLLHNDADDAVPWYQGIEFFLALRRLGKEAYLFTYNGEPHHLHRRPNQKDYASRMAQYFDFELKGGPKPAWMEKGIPYLHTPEQFTADQDKP